MAKDWMSWASKLDGFVDLAGPSVHSTVIRTKSPSLNFIFGHGHGLPLGHSLTLFGPPKSGKSVITKEMAAGIHRDYEDAVVMNFNTEYRERGQLTPEMMAAYGIDRERYIPIEANSPAHIYDLLDGKVRAKLADGLPLKLIIIDSMNGVRGVRAMNTDADIEKLANSMGDVARTNKEGLKVVLDLQRKYNIALAMCCHVAIETDPAENMRGNKFKSGASIGVQHHSEYSMFVEPNRNKDGRSDLFGTELADMTKLDMVSGKKGDKTGHKVRVVMKDSSMGPKGRMGQFTFDDHEGIINTWEELYLLGKNRGLFQKPSNTRWELPGHPAVNGEENFQRWFQNEPLAQDQVLRTIREQDLTGESKKFETHDAANAPEVYAEPTIGSAG